MYRVEFTEGALKTLKKMDRYTAAMLVGWIRKNLEGCSDPRERGKGLTANRTGQWRYRIGDYRIISEIQDEKITILVVQIGHRKDIYDA